MGPARLLYSFSRRLQICHYIWDVYRSLTLVFIINDRQIVLPAFNLTAISDRFIRKPIATYNILWFLCIDSGLLYHMSIGTNKFVQAPSKWPRSREIAHA